MQHVIRLTLVLLFTASLGTAAWAANAAPKQAEYKRSDTNYYWKGDVLKAEPNAVIITKGKYTQKGDSYFTDSKGKAPHEIYISVENDWIEPITPPTMPASLGVAPDAMQIREPQGDVTVALPTAPANFVPAQNNMAIPNGTVVKTGANGTAAILIGGVDSIRLIPNTSVAVDETVTAVLRTTTVNLTAGAVFSKVGKRIGEKQDYQVHTPFGVAAARGTDFVTIAMPARTDVWIAAGTVQMDQPDGKLVGTVKSDDNGALKIIRFPAMPDAHAAMMASAQTMTAAMNFIPTVNVYVKALDDKMAQGLKLTATERDYLNRIKKVPCLIKLALVEPPAPVPAPKPAPAAAVAPVPPPAAAPAPGAAPAPAATPAPAAPEAKPVPPPLKAPIDLNLRPDAKVEFQGATLTLDELKPKLKEIAKATPTQPFVINGQEKVKPAQLKKVTAMFHDAKLTQVTVAPAAPLPPPPPPPAPLDVALRTDGKVDFQGGSLTLDELKPKLQEIAKTTPTQPFIINGQEKVKPAEIKKLTAMFHTAKLTKVTVAPAAPLPPPPPPAPPPPPLDIAVRADGKVDFQGGTLTLEELKPKLQEIAKTTPTQPFVINGQEKVKPAEIKKLTAMFHAAKFTKVTVAPAAPLPPPPPPPAPLDLAVRADGKVDFQGGALTLAELKPKLKEIAKATPNQAFVVKRKEKVEKGQITKVVDLCNAAKLKVTVDKTPPPVAPAPPTPVTGATPPAAPASAPATPPPAPADKPLPPAMLLPINLDLRQGGKVQMQGETYTINELKIKLEEMGLTTPKQPLVVVPDKDVSRTEVKKLVALCAQAKLAKVTVAKAVPPPASAVANGDLPASPSPAAPDVHLGPAPSVTPASPTATSVASSSATNLVATPPHAPRPRSHVTAATAPISTGPTYTVP